MYSIPPENLSEEQKLHLNSLHMKLDQMYIRKANGAFVWCSANGEENFNYFFKLEKQRQTRNGLNKFNLDGDVIDNAKEIAERCEKYFKSVYKSKLIFWFMQFSKYSG